MALKPTIYKARVELADSDRDHYESLGVTLARHPSETLERLATRLIAYCLNAGPGLAFCRGLSETDEPDLWQHSDAGEIEHWIEVGQPEPGRIRKACGRARRVSVYAFGKSADTWFRQNGPELVPLPRLRVWCLAWEEISAAARLLDRNAQLSMSVVGGMIYLDNGGENASLEPRQLIAGD